MTHPANTLHARRIRIDTHDQPVVYMRSDCRVCRSEGFDAHSRVRIDAPARRHVVATLEVILDCFIGHGDAGLSEAALELAYAVDYMRGQLPPIAVGPA